MILEIIKRFEFAAAHKYWDNSLSESENFKRFGKDSLGKFGHGHNFIVYLYLKGPINPKTGMIMELSEVKDRIQNDVISYVDHRYLNDLPEFNTELPTPEAIAKFLLKKAEMSFALLPVTPTECHVIETAFSKAIATSTSSIQLNETQSSQAPNKKTFTIHATHCLTNTELTDDEQASIFGKCQFVHGHEFEIEVCLDKKKGSAELWQTAFKAIETSLNDWQYKSLNDEVPELHNKLCSCETIIQVLYEKLSHSCPYQITELVLKETPNNAFRLRKGEDHEG